MRRGSPLALGDGGREFVLRDVSIFSCFPLKITYLRVVVVVILRPPIFSGRGSVGCVIDRAGRRSPR